MDHHLLVPTDGSPPSSRCLTHAVALAKALKARITVFHALERRDALSGVVPYGLEAVAFDSAGADRSPRAAVPGANRAEARLIVSGLPPQTSVKKPLRARASSAGLKCGGSRASDGL